MVLESLLVCELFDHSADSPIFHGLIKDQPSTPGFVQAEPDSVVKSSHEFVRFALFGRKPGNNSDFGL